MTAHHGAGLSVRGESEDADQLGQSDHLHPPVPVFSDPSGEIAPCRMHRAQTGRELQLSRRRTPDRHKSRGLYGFFSNQSDSNNKLRFFSGWRNVRRHVCLNVKQPQAILPLAGVGVFVAELWFKTK